MVEAVHLTKKYGRNIALQDVSFTLETGRIYGLLGVNGAGKTTVLRLLSGYLEPTEGDVLYDGVSMKKKPAEVKARVGYLPEIPPLYPELTVEEYLSFQAELRNLPRKKRRETVEEALRQGGLRRVRNRLIGQLSKGFRQRVGLAGVRIGDPEVLLLDEATNGLDPVQMVRLRERIREDKENRVYVVSSHVLSEIEQLADVYLIIAAGKLCAVLQREELSEREESLEQTFLRVTEEAYREIMEKEKEEEEEDPDEEEADD